MIDINELRIGSLVRLASGSPKMTVIGFPGAAVPRGHKAPPRKTVQVQFWSERLGLVKAELTPEALVYPRVLPPSPVDPAREGESEDA
jgi:hypothetical protein